jgi:hypothetical protein
VDEIFEENIRVILIVKNIVECHLMWFEYRQRSFVEVPVVSKW